MNLLGATITVTSIGNWSDKLTLVLPNAPPNTPIQFRVNTIFNVTAISDPCPSVSGLSGTAGAAAGLIVTDAASAFVGFSNASAGTCGFANFASGPAILSAPVGSVLGLQGDFRITAVATLIDGTTGALEASADIKALNTAHYCIDIVTPGASYVTESGVSYSTRVPEPSTLLLGAGGLLLLAGARRRRRQVRV